MNEYLIDIPGRLHSVAVEKHIAGTDQIYDDFLKTTLDILNLENITDVKVQDGKLLFLNIQGLILKEISIASEQKQSDWNLTDPTQVDFIKNKPTVYNKLEVDDKLTTKQDTINDLATIRSGAQAGATAYQIPSTGIPATDLASDVQTDLAAIDGISELIPEQASSNNKLADKDFVNSSIATATATYRGSYNLVSDLLLSVSATQQQIADALATKMEALSITPDNNDYCFVQIPTADATPTEIARIDRYKYDGTAWAYEYSLNNSSFTAAQWAAINSGITSGFVAKLSALPTNSELTTLLSGKVDKENGKGLSANDYTTADKDKLTALPTAVELLQQLGNKANTADLAPVATSGNYDDLTGKPAVDNTPTPGSDNLVKSGGVYSTTPSIANTDAKSDLDVSDEDGNILMRLFGGHIKTKNFNSAEPVDLIFLADVSACKYSGNLMHIGFDDIYVCLTALFSQRPNSIYDITFFDNLRTLHNTYGACFSCYIYIESLENVTNTYANEFQAAKSWLRWNFHTHKNHVYNEDTSIESDYDLGITRLLTMVGNDKDCLDHELRGNMWELSLANAQYVRDNATHSSYIFFAKDAFSPSTGNYYLSEEQKTFVFNNGFLIDVKNRVLFIQTCARLDDNEKTAASKEYIAENIKWQKSCEVLNHERAFDYTRMDLFLDWAKNTMNFRFGFFDNIYKF